VKNSRLLSGISSSELKKASLALRQGNLVAFPTETVYGLGADATNSKALQKIFSVKGRPQNHPLIVHVHDMAAMELWVERVPDYAVKLAKKYWPGPMTLILNRSALASDFITGGQETVGIRIPNHAVALHLLQEFHSLGGLGIAAPSANRFGQISPTSAQDVVEELADHLDESDMILDGGSCSIGIESTIIDCTAPTPRILRPGYIYLDKEDSNLNSQEVSSAEVSVPTVSGSLAKHYAPKAKVILSDRPKPGQAFIALDVFVTPAGVFRISSPKDTEEFARKLYCSLREVDQRGFGEVVISPPTGGELEKAILDRLTKAANGR
jgi:L-threonylcarbamoyladenylate synthase